jgi:UTP--glucose-1-phosphate uridylyltransferase
MIRKAVLPVAGLGTRFFPASKATPKEMLPIIDKPLVQYAVEEAVKEGINEIIFITSNEKYSIEKHFKKNKKIENKLIKSGKSDFIEKLNPKIFENITFKYINQKLQKGLGDAVLQAEKYVKNESFVVLLPDDLFLSKKSCLSQILSLNKKTDSTVIALNKVDRANIHKYGVIQPGVIKNRKISITDIVEKPLAKNAPSDIAVCGRYVFKPSIFNFLKKVKLDSSNEIQLTNAIKLQIEHEEVFGCIYDGQKFDCGSKEGFVHATIALALKDKTINKKIKKIIRDIV